MHAPLIRGIVQILQVSTAALDSARISMLVTAHNLRRSSHEEAAKAICVDSLALTLGVAAFAGDMDAPTCANPDDMDTPTSTSTAFPPNCGG